ncbi:TIGR03905 family TSCPD domain-containing protein [Desulfofundulus thermobenzoicus]|uniref:ribonucleoside-diphosphate reductase n=1 Tax=Desulfofundulus thermobenzoicus TaxID=29376 RepID=A0A6N7IRP9_9FIRM|nr:TIGR03905 family TSCPD domain-containing protein [Desulfofundulus thermobenzoicus]MQL52722.1 TIGR03905 family TSCPD domain-containing protein [Desulfofundulus thermobenzoicus]
MYIYRTKGICPPEIHFDLSGNILTSVRFVGGGCRGNARLISRLLEGQEIEKVLPLMKGIQCRNDTSCPDQLYRAVQMALAGELKEESIRVYDAPGTYQRVVVCADINGSVKALQALLSRPADGVFCLGNLTGPDGENDRVVELARGEKMVSLLGPFDRTLFCADPKNQDYLLQAPLYLRLQLGGRRVLGFYGGFIQELSGFSDFAPYSLELLMVANLSDYLRNETVYPALTTMTEQFSVDTLLFASTGLWKHERLGKVDFINVGPVAGNGGYQYALLAWENEQLKVSFEMV